MKWLQIFHGLYIGESSPGRKTKNTTRIQTHHYNLLVCCQHIHGVSPHLTYLSREMDPPCEAALAVGIHVAVSVYLCFKYSPSSWLFGGRGRVGWLSCLTRRIHICYIYLHEWLILMVFMYVYHTWIVLGIVLPILANIGKGP